MPESTKAVFLSYASQDVAAALRICAALRAAGVEVWFDQDALVGGDAWDAKIRGQINSCALFIPVISAATQERLEGYFRLEWKLAANRSHTMAEEKTFLLPVVIDATRDAEGKVPTEFRAVQWTRLPGGEAAPAFVARVKNLLAGATVPAVTKNPESAPPRTSAPAAAKSAFPVGVVATLGVVVLGLVAFVALRPTAKETTVAPAPAKPVVETKATTVPSAAPLAGDQKSVAVLAFADMSADKGSEYFADGISEELLNVLAKVPGLRVAARTSAFFFKGKQVSIKQVASELGVAYVIEGSVRKAGDKVRITAQLIKADDGFHMWSDNFDRDLKDIFAVQDEIAGLIAKQLSLKLGASSTASTAAVKPEALELYLRARQAWNLKTPQGFAQADEALNRAIALEPNFAQAHALLAHTWISRDMRGWGSGGTIGQFGQRTSPSFTPIQSQIDRTLALEPNLDEAHSAQGRLNWQRWKFDEAERELRLAIALNASNATAHASLGNMLLCVGRIDEADAALQRAAELDPLAHRILDNRALTLRFAGRFAESLAFEERALALQPDDPQSNRNKAIDLSALGRHDEAVAWLRGRPEGATTVTFILGVFVKAGLRAEAEQRFAGVPAGSRFRFIGFSHLGRYEDALAALDPATVPVSLMQDVLFAPYLDPIRSDPRFVKFLATLGMTEAHARAQAWRKAHPPEKAAK